MLTPVLLLAALAAAPQRPVPTRSPVVRHVTLPDGLRMRYAEQGNRLGKPVVLLHGWTDSWHSFDRILPLLSPELHVFALDFRGHGGSGSPAAGYRTTELADDVIAFLTALKLDRVTLVGHSLGSFVAQEVVMRAPGRVARVMLVGSGSTLRTPAVLGMEEVMAGFRDSIPAAFVAEFQRSTVVKPVPAAFMDSAIAHSRRVRPHVWHAVYRGFLAPTDPTRLGRITVPTWMVWGDQDQIFPRGEQDALLRLIPGSKLSAYPGVGHAPHWEEPVRFVRDLNTFLATPKPVRTSR